MYLFNWPVLVVAVEDTIEDLPKGADVVQVIQNDHQRAVYPRDTAALLCQTWQVLTQLLQRQKTAFYSFLYIYTKPLWPKSQSWIDKPFKLNTESACVCYVPCWTCGPHWRWQWRAASEVGLPAATGVETTDWPGRSFPSRWGRTRWRACAPSAGRRSAAASASGSGCRKQGSPHSHCSHLGAHKHTHTHTHKHTHRSGYLSISKLHKLYWNHF